MTEDEKIRIKCLKLAMQLAAKADYAEPICLIATKFYEFLKGNGGNKGIDAASEFTQEG